jgi:thiamine biosynthesis lipoprotein
MTGSPEANRRFAALAAMGFERVEERASDRQVEPVDRRRVRVAHRFPAMGTGVAISAVVRSPAQADEAIGRALAEMERLIGIFSHYESGTAVTELNQRGRLDSPPPELARVIESALRFHRFTRGGFDITVAPVVELFRERRSRGSLPEPAEVREALELVGAGHIEHGKRRISLGRRGMRLTLDGIAKGYIVDAMAQVLESHRIKHYLLEAGGDIRVRGSRGGRKPWRVAVKDPDGGSGFPDQIELSRGAVATSGSYEEFYDPERKHHHIISADSGASPQLIKSVTVTAPSTMAADALATSVFLMDPAAGLRFLDDQRGCEGLIISHDDTRLKTRGWRSAAVHEPTEMGGIT